MNKPECFLALLNKYSIMNKVIQQGIINSRITELGTAVFHCHGNGLLNLRPTVIKTLKVDENGYIWFLMSRPFQDITEFEKQFPVALNYYKKGAPFFLNVFGVARIVTDPEELAHADLDSAVKNDTGDNMILVNVKIEHVNYYKTQEFTNMNWLTKIRKSLKDVLLPVEDFYDNSGFGNNRHFA
jgi:general stress protein 26